MEESYCILKNPLTGNYLCKQADVIDFTDNKDDALIYTEEVAKSFLHDMNTMTELMMNTPKDAVGVQGTPEIKQKFPGYQIIKVELDDVRLLPEWRRQIIKYANEQHIDYEQCKGMFLKALINYWSEWANYNPFGNKPYPKIVPILKGLADAEEEQISKE